jgi:hypothetical protein
MVKELLLLFEIDGEASRDSERENEADLVCVRVIEFDRLEEGVRDKETDKELVFVEDFVIERILLFVSDFESVSLEENVFELD